MARRRRCRIAEQREAWDESLPSFTSTWEEIERAVERNSIKRGAFIIKNLVALDFESLLDLVDVLAEVYDREEWHDSAELLSIDEAALGILNESAVAYPYYFCTPDILIEHPRLVLYYRNVAVVSQKVMNGLGLNTAAFEVGLPIPENVARELVEHFNTIISGLVTAGFVSPRRHLEMAFANLGDSFGGSWRNEVGRLAYVEVLTPLARYLHQRGVLASIDYKLKGRIVQEDEDETIDSRRVHTLAIKTVDDFETTLAQLEAQRVVYREFRLTNGNRLEINRQITWRDDAGKGYRIGPDLAAIDTDAGTMFWSGELKGGADPAGSDEHWKTATRAFDRILEASEATGRPQPKLSFLATIIVERVAREAALLIAQGKLTSVYNLTQLADDPQKQQQFHEDMATFLGFLPGSHGP